MNVVGRSFARRSLQIIQAFSVLAVAKICPSASLSMQQQALQHNNSKPPHRSRSFYQRPLPASCVAFSSQLGRRVFQSAMKHGGLKGFFALIEQHTTQTEPAYCGLATLVVALNSMAVDPRNDWKGPWRWYAEELLQCCQDFDLEDVKKRGITMEDFRCLAICQGLQVQVHHADDPATTIDTFREYIRQVCVENVELDNDQPCEKELTATGQALGQVLVVAYDRKTMGQTGSGHFAAIAAYDAVSDAVLILDTARFKYGSHWVPISLLWEALKPVDNDSGRSRGFIILDKGRETFLHTAQEKDSNTRVLLQAVTNSVMARQAKAEYQALLESSGDNLQWEDMLDFWTRKGTDSGFVWYFCDPVVKPCQEEEITVVEDALRQIRSQMHQEISRTIPQSHGSCQGGPCRPNFARSIPLLHTEAIYLIYLSSQDEQDLDSRLSSLHGAGGEALRATVKYLRGVLLE